MNELMVHKIRVKKFMKDQNLRVSPKFYDVLNDEIRSLLLKIAKRAHGNKRTTVLVVDA